MFKDLNQFITNYKTLLSNMGSLFTLKGLEYIVSFVTLPFLLRVLGPEYIGIVAFTQSIIIYANLFVDYGFNLTGPKDVAIASEKELPVIFSSIMVAKTILLVGIITSAVFVLLAFRGVIDWMICLYALPAIVGNAFFPIWYFQGKERMHMITVFNLIARIVSTTCIFLFIKDAQDFRLAVLFNAMVPFICAIGSLLYLISCERVLFIWPSYKQLKHTFRESFRLFASTILINLYTNSNIILLKLLTNNTIVGYFYAAYKIIESVKGLFNPIISACYPYVVKRIKHNAQEGLAFALKICKYIGGLAAIIALIIIAIAPVIAKVIMGQGYDESISVLRILAIVPALVVVSNVLGIHIMLALNRKKEFSNIIFLASTLNFIIAIPLIYYLENRGLAITLVVVELFVVVKMYYNLKDLVKLGGIL